MDCRREGGPASAGNFLNAATCSKTIALAGATRCSRKIFCEIAAHQRYSGTKRNMKFTNAADPNFHLKRDYREGMDRDNGCPGARTCTYFQEDNSFRPRRLAL
jgi:hypothetical protein